MKSNGKPSACYSTNPKMGTPYIAQGKGYADGGYVPDEGERPRSKDSEAATIGAETAKRPTKLASKRDLFQYKKGY